MSCECIKKTTENLKDHILKTVGKTIGFQKISKASFEHLPFVISDSKLEISQKIAMPFIVKFERKGKTSGKVRTYKETVSIFPTFCPFCGVKYKD